MSGKWPEAVAAHEEVQKMCSTEPRGVITSSEVWCTLSMLAQRLWLCPFWLTQRMGAASRNNAICAHALVNHAVNNNVCFSQGSSRKLIHPVVVCAHKPVTHAQSHPMALSLSMNTMLAGFVMTSPRILHTQLLVQGGIMMRFYQKCKSHGLRFSEETAGVGGGETWVLSHAPIRAV